MNDQESGWTETEADRLPGTGLDDISYRLTDTGNAEKFVAMWSGAVRYDHARKRWLVWDMHRWRPDDDATIWRCAVETVRQRFRDAENDSLDTDYRKSLAKWAISSESGARLGAMLRIARTRQPISVTGEGWDTTPGIVGAPNGVIGLRTGELRPGRPDDRITMHVGAEYDPEAECPRWESFVRQIVETSEEAAFLKRTLGYALTGEASEDLILILMGFGGNGKSTLLDLARRAAGDYGREISAQAFLGSRETAHTTEVADLENVRLATCEELGDAKLNANRLKAVSSKHTVVKARRMREDTRDIPVTWSLFLTTNGLPTSNDNSWAFWRRVKAVDFPHRFTPDQEPDLAEKLTAELPGILRWLVEGAVAYYDFGIVVPEAVKEKTAEYREDLDALMPVFDGGYFVACDDDIWTPSYYLHEAYKEYAQRKEIQLDDRRLTEVQLGSELRKQHRAKRRKAPDGNGGKTQFSGYHGVRVGPAAGATFGLGITSFRVQEDDKTLVHAEPLEGVAS